MSVKWNLCAELGRDNEDLRQQLEVESTRRMLNRLAGIFLLVIYGSVMLATLFVEEPHQYSHRSDRAVWPVFLGCPLAGLADRHGAGCLCAAEPLVSLGQGGGSALLLAALVWVVMRPGLSAQSPVAVRHRSGGFRLSGPGLGL